MSRSEFCKHHREYYLVSEKGFLVMEHYVSFKLGNNYLYDSVTYIDDGNSMCFLNEFIKQY